MQPDYLLLTFVVVVGALGAVLLLALVRLAVANRRAKQRLDDERDESALVTAALGEAVTQTGKPPPLAVRRAEVRPL